MSRATSASARDIKREFSPGSRYKEVGPVTQVAGRVEVSSQTFTPPSTGIPLPGPFAVRGPWSLCLDSRDLALTTLTGSEDEDIAVR
jgi:hypothetical protein